MTNKLRIRVIHDPNAEDPRDWDDMCEIVHKGRWEQSFAHQITNLIVVTNGWKAAMKVVWATYNEDDDSPTESDMEERLEFDEPFRNQWLEAVNDELIVETFNTQHESYIAHTTPELCKHVGTPWERASEAMAGSIETFKQWAEGDVYGYILEECIDVEDGDWIEVDSCWGFYGSDPFENGISDSVPEELHEQLRHVEIEYNN